MPSMQPTRKVLHLRELAGVEDIAAPHDLVVEGFEVVARIVGRMEGER